ncbi:MULTISPECIES: 2Fe-2S iron-sulfur cluster-binding protein [Streptomyces]|uniref:(2Fe-2S)-binding protein n=1 Tax=Streptomyces koelreuteriae TaxID=2838015 RepID=A0ABX8FW86_9ACTN|nr:MULTISPECIES: (2Fe-2S)-binding protein [Streptomyces]QWB25260.1 (2Fe-2S)-binding protein [Streptomyces koelreuteriae]UUA08298.1 2Fe-2S iron-sulfur cluster-binding protein [Streptomyces koelreuteriae]UUA15904.1 2Fe-2S iron-sulfur cluster-binding protein [Streptomyces sp. CRCS-T-1]
MTDDQHGRGTPPGGSRWDPLPQGEYDDGATAFVELPEGGIDALLAADSPLAAPGHGYVPPQITVDPATTAGTDPAATAAWPVPGAPVDGAQWHDPHAAHQQQGHELAEQPYGADTPYGSDAPYGSGTPYGSDPGTGQHGGDDRFTYNPGATGQWNFEEAAAAEPAPGHDVTGQWSIPVAGGDLPDESGEFTTSSLVEQWGGGNPPATLPGGAPAPWATQAPGEPWGQQVPQDAPGQEQAGPGYPQDHEHDHGHGPRGLAGAPSAYAPEQPPAGPLPQETDPNAPHPGGLGHAPEPSGFADHGVDHSADHAAESSGVPGHAPGPSGPAGHPDEYRAPSEASEPYEAHAAEPPAPPEAVQDASQAAPGTGEADGPAEDAPDAAEGADGPAEPVAVPLPETADADTDAGPEAAEGESPDAPAPEDPSGTPDDEAGAPQDGPALPQEEHPLASFVLRVNGTDRPVTDAWIGESLLYVLRERLGLAGAKDGCSQGECGACNVQVDGRLVASCLVPAVTAAGSEVRTVEGLAEDGQPSDVQRALARCGAVQCGFCVPGMAMTVHDLLEGNPAPTELETRQALCGNLCRCSGYRGVVDAVKDVVAERETHAGPAAGDSDEARIPRQAGPGAGGVHPSAFGSPPDAHGQDGHGPDPHSPDAHDQPYGQDGGPA